MLLAVLAVLTAAAAPTSPAAPADSALARIVDSLPGEPIALEDAIRTGLDGAVGVRSARANLRIARGSLREQRGQYDPVLFADFDRTGEDTPSASPFSGADVLRTTTTSVSAGARLKLPIGTEVAALLNTARLETNSLFAGLNPQYTTWGAFTLRQPLLKGFGPAANVGVASAARDLDAARARESNAALAVAADVESKYWDLHAAELDLAVRQLLVQQGKTLLEQATHKGQAGLVGPGEVATARTFLAEQQVEEISREEDLDATSDQLATLLGRRPTESGGRFRTSTDPPLDFPVESEDSLVARALASNGELRAAKSDLAAADARARAASWDRFPRVDVLGAIGGNGLAGTGQSITFLDSTYTTPSTGGFSESFDQVTSRDFPTWSVGMSVEIPIFLRQGRGERERTLGAVESSRARVDEVQRSVEEQVRARRRELEHGARRLELARTGVEAALEQARIGQIEYQNGRNTAFELVRLSGDVASAQQRYSEAIVRTAKAAAELRRLAPVGAQSGSEAR